MDNFDNFDNFWQFWTILTILTIFYNFYNIDYFNICLQFWQLKTIFTIQTIAFAILAIEKAILETSDIWDTDYNSDNWKPDNDNLC